MLARHVLLTLFVFWHTLAFAAGGVNVAASYRGLFSGRREPEWARIIRSAEWQLWVSGMAIITLGLVGGGWQVYLANPKLWAKLAVVTVWLGSTLVMRHVAVPRLRLGLRTPMLWTCSVSGACWLYGAFLGVAKPLAGGVVPLAVFLAGFAAVIMGCLAATAYFEAIKRRALRSQADGSLRQSKQTADASR
jgi:hypothetical protein